MIYEKQQATLYCQNAGDRI